MFEKQAKLPPRKTLHGWDYNKSKAFSMTGKEWNQYAGTTEWKVPRDRDARDTLTSGKGIEVYLRGGL